MCRDLLRAHNVLRPPFGTYSAPKPLHTSAGLSFFPFFLLGNVLKAGKKEIQIMFHFNSILMEITGRVTADATVRTLSDERQVVNFAVAVNDTYKAKNGERVTQTEFFDCSYWVGTGIAPYLTKGKIVELAGRVSVRAWIDGKGQPKAGLNFNTSKITLHGGGQADGKAAEIGKSEAAKKDEVPNDDLPF